MFYPLLTRLIILLDPLSSHRINNHSAGLRVKIIFASLQHYRKWVSPLLSNPLFDNLLEPYNTCYWTCSPSGFLLIQGFIKPLHFNRLHQIQTPLDKTMHLCSSWFLTSHHHHLPTDIILTTFYLPFMWINIHHMLNTVSQLPLVHPLWVSIGILCHSDMPLFQVSSLISSLAGNLPPQMVLECFLSQFPHICDEYVDHLPFILVLNSTNRA